MWIRASSAAVALDWQLRAGSRQLGAAPAAAAAAAAAAADAGGRALSWLGGRAATARALATTARSLARRAADGAGVRGGAVVARVAHPN